MLNYLMVGLGAAAGGMTRYWLAGVVQKVFPAIMPYGTLSVNIAGGLLIGLIMFYLDTGNLVSPPMKLLLTVGFCGGLTTFSAFSYETLFLLTESEYFNAAVNVFLNVFLALIATSVGLLAAKFIGGFHGN